jgi:A/G-specific adenine glycosylase
LIDLELDPRSREGEAALIEAGEALLPSGRASEFNQALMDLGAAICLPKRPACDLCPVKRHCLAQARGVQDQRPVRPAKRSIPHHTVAAGVLRSDGRVFIARRPAKGLLGGLWEFPGGKLEAQETLQQALQRELQEELGLAQVQIGDQIGVFQHAYTHFRVTLHAFECRLLQGEPDPLQHEAAEWVLPPDLGQYPMGKLDRLIAARLQ